MVIGLGAALVAAVLFGGAAVLQAIAARRHGLVSWLMALVALIYLVGWGLHVVSIARLPLYLAQVGIAGSLAVTALIASRVVHEPLATRHWVAVAALIGGLGMLTGAAGEVGAEGFNTTRTVVMYAAAAVILVASLAARRVRDERGGVLLGVLGGIAYAGSPIATRSLIDPSWDVNTVAPALAIGVFGLMGFWLYSLGLRRASVTAVTAPLVLLETLVPSVVGVLVFGDGVRTGRWGLAAVGFVISIGAALVLSGAESRLEHLEETHPDSLAGRPTG